MAREPSSRCCRVDARSLGPRAGCFATSWHVGGDEIRFLKGLRVFDATLEFAFRPDVFSPRRATKALFDLVDQIELFNASCRPWPVDAPIDPDRRRTQIRLKVAAAVRLAVALAPIAPGFARQLGVALLGASPR